MVSYKSHTYDDISEFSEGIAIVKLKGKYVYIDIDGNPITDIIFDGASNFDYQRAMVDIGWRIGYIHQQGKFVVVPKFDAGLIENNSHIIVILGAYNGNIDLYGFIIGCDNI